MMNKEAKPSQGWSPQLAELKFLMNWVAAGHGWCATHFVGRHRLSDNARGSNVVVVDIDGDTTLDHFWNSPTALDWCAATYTSCSHTEDSHRFRALFPLGLELQTTAQHKAAYHFIVSRLLADLGIERLNDNCGEKPERLWYGNTNALTLYNTEPRYHLVPADILETIEVETDQFDFIKSDITELDLERCRWLLDNFINVTEDGEYSEGNTDNRSSYIQVTAACAGIGECIFDSWVHWVSRGHHGEKESNLKADKWTNLGDYGGHKRLYGIAKQQDPNWRLKLPSELKFRAEGSATGYAQCDPEPNFAEHIAISTQQTMDNQDYAEPTPDVQVSKSRGRPKKNSDDYSEERQSDFATVKSLLPNLRKNLLTGMIEYTSSNGELCVLQGYDLDLMSTRFCVEYNTYIPETRCKNAVMYAAEMNKHCPIRAYLDHCSANSNPHPDWENVGQLFLGNKHKLATLAFQRMMIGAVARAYDPGCSMSWVPILVGAQGVGKSMLARNLVPKELFAEVTTPLELLMKEQYRLHTGWILELPEIDNYFSVKNIENFKNLITARVDETRRPYATLPEKLTRRFIMIGTTNRNQFLVDSTGNRRFIPLEIPSGFKIPFEQIANERDSLWASAIAAYRSNVRHEFHSDEINQINEYIQEFGDPDPWTEIVSRYVNSREEVRAVDVLSTALNLEPTKQDRRASRRVCDVLTSLGWRRLNTTREDDTGNKKSVRLWQRPKNDPINPENHIMGEY